MDSCERRPKNHCVYCVIRMFEICESRPQILHLFVVVVVVLYAVLGGWIFLQFEADAHAVSRQEQLRNSRICVDNLMNQTNVSRDSAIDLIVGKCFEPFMDLDQWTYSNSILYSFTVMTTVGYGKFAPLTDRGRLFSILFALLGIPLTMLILGNIGKHLKAMACSVLDWGRNMFCKQSQDEDQQKKEQVKMTAWILLSFFLLYLFLGTVVLLLASGMPFVSSLYYTFTSLTGGDFRHMASGRLMYLPMKLAYAAIGLAIATVAIDIGSDYLKKLHNVGKKLRNAGQVMIWFGGKRLSVHDLVMSIAKKCGMDQKHMDSLNIDQLVEETIEAKQNGTLYQRQNTVDEDQIETHNSNNSNEHTNASNASSSDDESDFGPGPPPQANQPAQPKTSNAILENAEVQKRESPTEYRALLRQESIRTIDDEDSGRSAAQPTIDEEEEESTEITRLCAQGRGAIAKSLSSMSSLGSLFDSWTTEPRSEKLELISSPQVPKRQLSVVSTAEVEKAPPLSPTDSKTVLKDEISIAPVETKIDKIPTPPPPPLEAEAEEIVEVESDESSIPEEPGPSECQSLLDAEITIPTERKRRATTPEPPKLEKRRTSKVPDKKRNRYSIFDPEFATRRASREELGRMMVRHDPLKRYELYQKEWSRLHLGKGKQNK